MPTVEVLTVLKDCAPLKSKEPGMLCLGREVFLGKQYSQLMGEKNPRKEVATCHCLNFFLDS